MSTAPIKDIQKAADNRAVAIDRVGVCRVKLPLLFSEAGADQPSIGEWSAFTDLTSDVRGTHMSRLVRLLQAASARVECDSFRALPRQIRRDLGARTAMASARFTFFVEKRAPVSKEVGFLDARAALYCEAREGEPDLFLLRLAAPIMTLCPCSKAISAYGAHNQRSRVIITAVPAAPVLLRDLFALAESAASAELYPVLKRPDEKYVTERAYDNPKFVEDVARDLAVELSRLPAVAAFRVEAENFESIHNHSAYAMVESEGFPARDF